MAPQRDGRPSRDGSPDLVSPKPAEACAAIAEGGEGGEAMLRKGSSQAAEGDLLDRSDHHRQESKGPVTRVEMSG